MSAVSHYGGQVRFRQGLRAKDWPRNRLRETVLCGGHHNYSPPRANGISAGGIGNGSWMSPASDEIGVSNGLSAIHIAGSRMSFNLTRLIKPIDGGFDSTTIFGVE